MTDDPDGHKHSVGERNRNQEHVVVAGHARGVSIAGCVFQQENAPSRETAGRPITSSHFVFASKIAEQLPLW